MESKNVNKISYFDIKIHFSSHQEISWNITTIDALNNGCKGAIAFINRLEKQLSGKKYIKA